MQKPLTLIYTEVVQHKMVYSGHPYYTLLGHVIIGIKSPHSSNGENYTEVHSSPAIRSS